MNKTRAFHPSPSSHVDDEPIARLVLREEVELHDDLEIVGEAATEIIRTAVVEGTQCARCSGCIRVRNTPGLRQVNEAECQIGEAQDLIRAEDIRVDALTESYLEIQQAKLLLSRAGYSPTTSTERKLSRSQSVGQTHELAQPYFDQHEVVSSAVVAYFRHKALTLATISNFGTTQQRRKSGRVRRSAPSLLSSGCATVTSWQFDRSLGCSCWFNPGHASASSEHEAEVTYHAAGLQEVSTAEGRQEVVKRHYVS